MGDVGRDAYTVSLSAFDPAGQRTSLQICHRDIVARNDTLICSADDLSRIDNCARPCGTNSIDIAQNTIDEEKSEDIAVVTQKIFATTKIDCAEEG